MRRSTPPAAPLVATTRRLSRDVDPLAVAGDHGVLFEHPRRGLAGRGVATRVPIPRHDPAASARAVHGALAAIERDDDVGLPGCGPVALGALPFDPAAPATLVVPALVVGRGEDGTHWVTTVAPGGTPPPVDDLDELLARDARRAAPGSFDVAPSRPPADWEAAVASARDELRAGVATKVVLAREVVVHADAELSPRTLLGRLRSAYPGCMLYAVEGFVGASPELLVSRTGDVVRSHPMAGTTPRSADPDHDARLAATLLASDKDRVEHRITIDMVHDTLLPWCSWLDEEAEPSVVPVANVQHLATMVEGRLSAPAASVVELLCALHPTPAVCGMPRSAALGLIERYEHLDRGRYAGPVGWVDAEGDGDWAVGIRCAQLEGARARLYAGVGVVADSDPAAELAETRAKLQALLSAIVRP
ncbi:MAG: isochorismate synthase [Acidimicrobiales bacterium]|jgi:menaquinone-specific isochorismate synthase|nr:isochorismate synthase [Acidimicrobiales bacterium]